MAPAENMPDGEGMSQDSFGRGSAMLSHRNLATSDQFASSASIMVPHRAPPVSPAFPNNNCSLSMREPILLDSFWVGSFVGRFGVEEE